MTEPNLASSTARGPLETDALINLLSHRADRLDDEQLNSLKRQGEIADLFLDEFARGCAVLRMVENLAAGLGLDRAYFRSRYEEQYRYYLDLAKKVTLEK